MIKEQGGLNSLVNIVKVESHKSEMKLLEAATGAIWKCLMNPDNVKRLEDINGIHVLVKLLDSDSEEVSKKSWCYFGFYNLYSLFIFDNRLSLTRWHL